MVMLRSKQGLIRCRKGQSIRTTRAVAFQVTDCTNGCARLRFVAVEAERARLRTPGGGRHALRKGQRFFIDPSVVLTVVGCQNGSVRLNIRAVADGVASPAGLNQAYFTSRTERRYAP
jgi:hypothetical protein